jgi:hypothetical protein
MIRDPLSSIRSSHPPQNPKTKSKRETEKVTAPRSKQ